MGYIKEVKYKMWREGESYELTSELSPGDDVVMETMRLKKLVSGFFEAQKSDEEPKPEKTKEENRNEKILEIIQKLEEIGDKGKELEKILQFNKVSGLGELTLEQAERVLKYLEGKK